VAGRRDGPAFNLNTKGTAVIDTINGWTGEFVAFWSIIAVFVYYYEVIARYVFNSPTNWAHKAMFLMFGMQYLIAGAYALREDAHVRVDVIFLLLPDRVKVVTDLVTSVFFFAFAVTLMVTGFIFMSDAIDVFEVSFTEWAIQYWPVKITIVLGALLLLFQGISKLIKDIALLKIRFA
jgi:TRAP-type mannitol/chloroaromatic compound transport system permease small subunit